MRTLTMVGMAHPCSACVMLQGLIREVVEKVRRQRADVQVEERLLTHPSEAYEVDGLEVERYPALLIDGEQITAGTLISTKQILSLLDEME